MSEIKIDKGIPCPPPSRNRGTGRFPFRSMEIGDSFFTNEPQGIVSAHCSIQKRLGVGTFSMRKQADGYRVWRVA